MNSYDDENLDDEKFQVQESDQVIWKGRPSQWVNIPFIIYNCLLGYGAVYGQWFLKGTTYAEKYRDYIVYLDYLVIFLLSFLFLKVLHRMLSIFYTKYELTSERLIEYTGITQFLQNGEPLELYNIFDYKFPPPLLMALWGRGSLILLTHDSNQPMVHLRAIKNKRQVYEVIRNRVEVLRISKKSYFNGPSG